MQINKDKFLLISTNYIDTFVQDTFLLKYLGTFEYRENSDIILILDEKYNENFIYKLLNVISYLVQSTVVCHYIKVYTSNELLLRMFEENKVRLGINNNTSIMDMKQLLIDNVLDFYTRELNSIKQFNTISLIKEKEMLVYNPDIYVPTIKIKIKH